MRIAAAFHPANDSRQGLLASGAYNNLADFRKPASA
jgi:hypothetical protein